MLRGLVVLLLLANAALWAWREGWLGIAPAADDATREPQRLAQQVEPHRLRLLKPSDSASPPPPAKAPSNATPPTGETSAAGDAATAAAPAPAPEPRRCWQLAALPPDQAAAALRAADRNADLRGRHTEQAGTLPARWIVYLGKFASPDALQTRRAELRAAGIDHREVNVPALAPGLALGTYSTEDAARKALADAQRQGVRDARVVQERAETRVLTLRWPDLTAAEHERLRAALGAAGRGLAACP